MLENLEGFEHVRGHAGIDEGQMQGLERVETTKHEMIFHKNAGGTMENTDVGT